MKKHYSKLLTSMFLLIAVSGVAAKPAPQKISTRQYWVSTLDKIARPVISNLSQGELRAQMPIQTKIDRAYRVGYLEAFGRTFSGIAPWLELGADQTAEGQLRREYIEMTIKAIDHATNPTSADFMNFTTDQQPLVDAAFFAHGLIRSKTQIWEKLDARVQRQVVECLKSTRQIRTPSNNWLLFSGTIEAFLLDIGQGGDVMRLDYAINKHLERYKGDGVYGDGDNFHWDYYNSFVIQPMMVDIMKIMNKHRLTADKTYETVVGRFSRYAQILEYSISPEGTFPVFGRSLTYRMGAFQALGQVALMEKLPQTIAPAQVRCAMTAVMRRLIEPQGTFDDKGWLRIGLCGSQPSLGEAYINTGSLYLCCTGLLPLGLPAENSFWSDSDQDWTSVKIWKGVDMQADHSI